MNKLLSTTYRAFRRVNGFLISFFSALLAILAWRFGAEAKVPLWIATSVFILGSIIIITLADALFESLRRNASLPLIKKVVPGNSLGFSFLCTEAILLVEKSELFAVHEMISLFATINDYEVQVRRGYVSGFTTNGHIQALVAEYPEGAHPDVWQKILNNDRDVLATLNVKPSVSRHSLAY